MNEDLAKTYVDRLLLEGFAIDVTGDNTIVIVDPPNAANVLAARHPEREANLNIHKDVIASYLKKLQRVV